MKKYDTVLFDLDGTLTNPEAGLVSSFAYALGKMGVDYGPRAELTRFIGPPLYSEWRRVFGFTEAEGDRALMLFREYYAVYGWWDNVVYDGVREMLSALKESGLTLAVATSKPEFFARKVLARYSLDGFFDFVGAADGDRRRDRKEEVIEYVFENLSSGCRGAVLVGDRKYDAEGARLVGIDSIGALWGHGSEAEIDGAGFTYKARTPSDVTRLLLG